MALETNRKIVVVGAGAIGSLVGGLLARAGEKVTLIARKAHVDAILENGLRIDGVLGSFTVPVSAAVALDFKPDLVLLAVKAQDVETACRQIEPYVQQALVVTLQNGVRSDIIVSSLLPKENIISGVVMFNGQYLKPGQVSYGGGGPLVIGEAFTDNGPRVREIRELLGHAIPTKVSDNIRAAHWTKLLQNNLGNGLEAITGLPVTEFMRHAGVRRIGLLAVKESYRVINKAGFRPGPLPGLMAPVLLLVKVPLPMGSWMMSLFRGSVKTVVGSTLQSLRRGRPTEIDYLNGEIVRLGQQAGMPTPYNSLMVDLVKEVEKSGQFYSCDELIRRFSGVPNRAI
jgi:2-dehydropantoate 2-reductase